MKKPKIIIVGADKGGVGKTTITRILHDYMNSKGVACRYFDTEWPAGDLHRFIPEAEVIDISKVQSQMKIFDILDENVVTILDLRSGMLLTILEELENARLLEEVQAGRMNLVLLHILGSTISSLNEIASAAERMGGGVQHFLVKNFINDSTFFEWDADQANSPLKSMADLTITIPELNAMAAETIQKSAVSFTTYAKDKNSSRVLTGKVNGWIKTVFKEFDRIEISKREDA